MKKHCLTLLLLFAVSAAGFASQDAGQESPFSVGVGARALGMGGGFTALADDATAVFYNPAGLPGLPYQQFSFMHMRLFEGTTINYAAWALATLSFGGLGISYARIGTDDLIRRSDFIETGSFTYAQSQIQFSYGKNLFSRVNVGASLKVVRQTIDSFADNGIGLDAGVLVPVYKQLHFSMVVRNAVQATLRLKSTDEKLPISVISGVGLREMPLTQHVLFNGAAEFEQWERRALKFHGGGEVVIGNTYALRAGYDRDNFTFGGGLKYRRVTLDYAYKLLSDLEDSHQFSLAISVGTSISDQQKRREIIRQQEGSKLIAGDRKRQFEFFRSRGETYYGQFELDSALQNYERALAFDPDNQEIVGTIAAIRDALETKRSREQQIAETARTREISLTNLLGQAETLYRRGEYGAARDVIRQIEELQPENEEAHKLRLQIDNAIQERITAATRVAQEAASTGDLLTVIDAYGQVLKLDSANIVARDARQQAIDKLNRAQLLNTGLELYKFGRYDEARDRFTRLLALESGNPVAIEYISKIDRALAKPPTLEELQQDKDIWPLYLEGLRFMREKDYKKAIDLWEKVLEKYPNNPNTLDNIEQARLRLQSEGGK